MKYNEMIKFLNNNGILLMQPIIADAVDSMIPIGYNMSEEEYENICEKIFNDYINSSDEPDIWELIRDEFLRRGIN